MRRRLTIGSILAILAILSASWFSIRPSGDRDWAADQARSAIATFRDSTVTIDNVRHFDHCPAGGVGAIERWERRSYDLRDLRGVWLALSVFGRGWRGPAHPFLSFEFGDTSFVAVSVEARRERGESYSIPKGMLKRFELMYVFADERDIIRLRVLCRDDLVYLYPVAASPDKARRLFVEIVESANRLREHPEFYNTIWNNCTTTILEHVNAVTTRKIPWGAFTFLPGYSDEEALSYGLIDAAGTIDEVRARFEVNERVRRFADRPDFSAAIRDTAWAGGI